MPGNLNAAAPATVLPKALCSAFSQDRVYEIEGNEYANGEYQREVKASSSRKSWVLTRRLTSVEMAALRTFYLARRGGTEAFWFYDSLESTPLGNWDATGVSANGRFVVCFEGPLDLTMGLGRWTADFRLREIS